MKFDWDTNKNKLNIEKHGLDFEEAKELFINKTLWRFEDIRITYNEVRYIGFGYVNNRLLNVVYTKRYPDIIRLISLRKANKREVKSYEKNFKN